MTDRRELEAARAAAVDAANRGDWEGTVTKAEALHDLAADDPASQCQALLLASKAHRFLAREQKAAASARMALEIARATNDRASLTEALLALGYLHWRRGDHATTEDFFGQALAAASTLGRPALLGLCHQAAADYASSRYEFERSIEHYTKAAPLLAEAGMWVEWVRVHNNWSIVHTQRGEHERAIALLEGAFGRTDPADSSIPRLWMCLQLGDAFARAGRPGDARRLLDEAERRLELSPNPVIRPALVQARGMQRAAEGDLPGALLLLRSALPGFAATGSFADGAGVLLDIATIQKKGRDREGMLKTITEAYAVLDQDDAPALRKEFDRLRDS